MNLSTLWNAHVAEIDSDLFTDLIIPTFSKLSTININLQKATEKATNNRQNKVHGVLLVGLSSLFFLSHILFNILL